MGARPNFLIECQEHKKGCRLIAGIDEAGRGSLAGPLSVCMVIYPEHILHNTPDELASTVDDSKKLSHKKRLLAKDIIRTYSLWHACVLIPPEIIDEKNINGATNVAITSLLRDCTIKPDLLLIDGNFSFQLSVPYRSIIQGDSTSMTIASASIIAKVTRDEYMIHIDAQYPQYGFAQHKGYATAFHMKALKKFGPSPIHRRTYEPIATILSQELSLF